MLFGGLRERLPFWAAALISGAIFGALHATTGISAVPPLMIFGFLLALLYEKTGSIVPRHPPAHAEQFRRPARPVAFPPVNRRLLMPLALSLALLRAPPPPPAAPAKKTGPAEAACRARP